MRHQNGGMKREQWIGKDENRTGRGLITCTATEFAESN